MQPKIVCTFSYYNGYARVRVHNRSGNLYHIEVLGEDLPDLLKELVVRWNGLEVRHIEYREDRGLEITFNNSSPRRLEGG